MTKERWQTADASRQGWLYVPGLQDLQRRGYVLSPGGLGSVSRRWRVYRPDGELLRNASGHVRTWKYDYAAALAADTDEYQQRQRKLAG